MMRVLRKILLTIAFCAVPLLAHAETRVALVIGNSNYLNAPRLANPANDAAAVAAALRQVGFGVVDVQTDLGKNALERALQKFARTSQGADAALIYYAGHGIEVAGANYLVPVDAALAASSDVRFEAVPLDSALAAVSGARRLKLVVLDSCRTNPFSLRMAGANRDMERGLAPLSDRDLEGDTLVEYAAKAGSPALDGQRNSPFAAALARDIATPGLDILRVFGKVRDDVLAATGSQQEPHLYGTAGAEPFFFVPGNVQPVPVPPMPAPFDPRVIEKDVWDSVKDTNDPRQLQSYLDQYPNGSFAGVARAKIAALNKPAQQLALNSTSNTPAPPALNALVQQAVDAAHAAERQARERATAARQAQARAQQAAQQATAGVSGYGVVDGPTTDGGTARWAGQVANNLENGVGVFVFTSGNFNGDRYEGEISGNVRIGVGTYSSANGDRYEGEEHDSHYNGVGVYTFASTRSNRELIGQWASDHLSGYGVINWKDGTTWIGNMKDDTLNGYGAKLDAQGRVVEQGYYEAGTLKTAMTP